MQLEAIEVASVMKGVVERGNPKTIVSTVSIDTRTLIAGDLFFAIVGPNHDGHCFIPEAIARGAIGIVVSQTVENTGELCVLRVLDTAAALQQHASVVRHKAGLKVVAITGSMGKTTTKEAAAAAISSGFRVLKSRGNLNNLYGLPLSLLQHRDEEVAVVELGMSAPGEIARLTEIAGPDVGLLTNIGPVHLEFFPTVESIADAKGELLVGLTEDAVAVVNADDPLVLRQARKFAGRLIRFGLKDGATIRAHAIEKRDEGLRFQVTEGDDSVHVASPLRGTHNVYNLLAGLAAARALGLPLGPAAESLSEVTPLPHRGERLRLAPGFILVDETYNSNHVACVAALDALAEEPAARRLAVLGDMRELGDQSESLHREVGREAAQRDLSFLIGVGELGRFIVEGALEAGMPRDLTEVVESPEEVAQLIAQLVLPEDVVLFKASRSLALDEAIRSLERVDG